MLHTHPSGPWACSSRMCLRFCLCTRGCLAPSVHACPWPLSILCLWRSDLHFVPPCPTDLYPLWMETVPGNTGPETQPGAMLEGQCRGEVGGKVDQTCSALPGDWEPQQPKRGEVELILETLQILLCVSLAKSLTPLRLPPLPWAEEEENNSSP